MTESAAAGPVDPQSPTPSAATDAVTAISQEIAARIKSSADEVRKRVIDKHVEEEVTNRANGLVTAYQHHKTLKSALNRIKPDVPGTFDVKGEVVTPPSFTKAATDARKKLEEGFKKVDAALKAALDGVEGSFDKLREAVSKTKDLAKGAPAAESPTEE